VSDLHELRDRIDALIADVDVIAGERDLFRAATYYHLGHALRVLKSAITAIDEAIRLEEQEDEP